jgi:catechol 2,3-dioxygenase-like lactoylglutathione lyase family enzyme
MYVNDPMVGRFRNHEVAVMKSDVLADCAVVASPAFPHRSARMETQELHRGRLIDHVQLVVKDLARSKRFYTAVFDVLKIPLAGEADDYFWADELFISTQDSQSALGALTGRVHLAFQGRDRETVQRFHAAALAAGGKDNGAPGERPYHPGYFAAFVLDPDGNNIEVVFHGPAKRSAESVKVTF